MTESAKSALIHREDCQLLVIDIQEKLLPVIANRDEVRTNAGKLVQFAGIIRLPVVVTEQDKLGATVGGLLDGAPKPEIFPKITFDCFGDDAFRAFMGLSPRKTLILCGIETHICVMQTALTALALGYRVHVAADAVGSRTPSNRELALRRLEKAGAVISSTEMVIYELLRRAGTSEFKDTLKLVK